MAPDQRIGFLRRRIIAPVGEIVLYIAASLDGYIADRDGGVGWLERFNTPGEDHGYVEFLSQAGSVIMGATTYEQELSRQEWPYGARPTWVFTHRRLPKPDDADVRFVSGIAAEHIEEIRNTTDRAVYLAGGAHVVEQFMAEGAVDRMRLFIVPLLLGEGIRLLAASGPTQAELLGTKTYRTGLVELHYRLNGHPPPGQG